MIAATAHAASISTAAKAGDWTRMRMHCVDFMITIDGRVIAVDGGLMAVVNGGDEDWCTIRSD